MDINIALCAGVGECSPEFYIVFFNSGTKILFDQQLNIKNDLPSSIIAIIR